MATKTLSKHPFERIESWSVTALHNVPVYINPDWGVELPAGCSVDVEDDEQGGFVGLGIYVPAPPMTQNGACYYWSSLENLPPWFSLPKFVAHNGISDIRKLQKWGFKIDESWLLWDTQLYGHIIDSSLRTYGLKDMVKRELGFEYPSYESICGKKGNKSHKTLVDFPVAAVAEYNACDTYYTHKLYEKQRKEATAQHQLYFGGVEKPVSEVFFGMQDKGIRIDTAYLTKLEADLSSQRNVLETTIKNELGDINLNSPKQLLGALHAKEIYPEFKGKPSTDKRALERIARERSNCVNKLLHYSELSTLLDSFVLPYLARGTEVVHPQYLQTGTRTGRPSCSNPNLLQIPRKTENGKLVRRMFIPRDNSLFGELDYGQIEPRLLAHLSHDASMLEMFNTGIDFHTYTSERLAISRDQAKVLNLSVGYRATFKSVSQQLKCSDQEAQKQIDAWWSAFPALHAWQTKLIWQAKKDGFFTTLMGRRIKVDGLGEYNKWKRESSERQLINNIAQASATEVMKHAMVGVHLQGINVLVQVYDSLLIEEPKEHIQECVERTAEIMTQAVKLDVPLTVDSGIGPSWADIAKGS